MKVQSREEAEAVVQKIKEEKMKRSGCSEEEIRESRNNGKRGGERNMRKLFSTNPQHAEIDEGDAFAYEGEYIYIASLSRFRIIHAVGLSLTEISV